MISNEFSDKLSNFPNLKKKLQGIYSSDTIPKRIKNNHFIICNTDNSKGVGKHWYCIVKLNSSQLECFDSLGIDNIKKDFLKTHFNFKGIRKIKFNVTQVQSSFSDTCGYFVLYFIVNRFHNLDLSYTELVNEIFVKSESENENLVKEFTSNLLKNE